MAKGKENPTKAASAQPGKAAAKAAFSTEQQLEVEVEIEPDAQLQFEALPLPMQARAREVFMRLRSWPNVSGAKPLRKKYTGSFRIRTGDYRIVFKPLGKTKVSVWKVSNRKDVYLD